MLKLIRLRRILTKLLIYKSQKENIQGIGYNPIINRLKVY